MQFRFANVPQKIPADWQPSVAIDVPACEPFDFARPFGQPIHEPTRAVSDIEGDWEAWLQALFAGYVQAGYSDRHREFWLWVWAMESGIRPRPFIGIWPRGGGKSTSAELACVAIGARAIRPYAIYVSETQDQADKHVQTIATLLESRSVDAYYPAMASRLIGKYGASKGWRRNQLRTAAGFTVDALGLDTGARGIKIDEHRPGLIVFDDLDGRHDSAAVTKKKIEIITETLLPAGASDVAILGMQNLIHPDSVFARLADNRADFLSDRIVSGPHLAIDHLTYEQRANTYGRPSFVITGGIATWAGQSLDICQAKIDDQGITAFLSEAQHKVEAPAGGMFDHLAFPHCTWGDVPDLVRTVVWCDPAVTNTDESDAHGIQADGLAPDGTIYRLWSWEDRTSPQDVLKRALLKAVELGAECVGVETDQGGDTWESVFREAWRTLQESGLVPADAICPAFRSAKAGQGHGPKAHRGSQMLADYEHGRFVHVVGTHTTLERGLKRFPKTKPLDLADAAWWAWYDLTVGVEQPDATNSGVFLPEFFAVARTAR